jgi:hypothetical protein
MDFWWHCSHVKSYKSVHQKPQARTGDKMLGRRRVLAVLSSDEGSEALVIEVTAYIHLFSGITLLYPSTIWVDGLNVPLCFAAVS